MEKIKKKLKRIQLSLMFAAIVFLIFLVTMSIVFIGIFVINRLGLPILEENNKIPLFALALFSLVIGTISAFLFSRKPLQPIRTLGEAADRIADGDYSVRIQLKGPDELVQLSGSFNHMAEELGSVEMLRTDFVNNFSHEFKTPIVSIRGFAKMLKRDDLTAEERSEYLDIIISESERLTELATNVLNLTKLEQQTILTNLKNFNVSEQIRLVIAMLESKWREKQISFDFDCDEIYIRGNEELLQQVWINLLDNAIKFSPDKAVVGIQITRSTGCTVFTISNPGEQMTAEAAKHIFDKFYQADKAHNTQGNGLGLAIVKRIVELHNGSVSVGTSAKGIICFEIKLPTTK
jgi:integral membrane sensor signal transduction histidine kinase